MKSSNSSLLANANKLEETEDTEPKKKLERKLMDSRDIGSDVR